MNKSEYHDYYSNKVILAPMVRENSLPLRLLCLDKGADLVYTEELIDHRLSTCQRVENKSLGTIDFIDEKASVMFRTCSAEKEKLILQIGSNDPDRALRSIKLVQDDVSGIDFNFGCPKSFSLSGGMGAALLEKPDTIKALLTTCSQNVNLPITCKIRILPDIKDTLELVKLIESCGVAAIAVHGRTKNQRPQHENNEETIREVVRTASIPVICNGGSKHIKSYSDVIKFKESCEASSVMIARAAMSNPSIFRSDGIIEPVREVIEQFIKLAIRYENTVANTKYTIQAMMASENFGGDFVKQFYSTKDMESICNQFNLSDWFQNCREP